MFFSKAGVYPACGMYTIGHLCIFLVTIALIGIAVFFTRKFDKKNVLKTIRIFAIVLWILEILKIIFNFKIGNGYNLNTYVPLYYCSLILYSGILSGFCKDNFKRTGDVFLATGAIVAGICFLACPTTSIKSYPLFHFISFHSFFLHGSMIYLGLLVNITNYIELKREDIKYYFCFIIIIGMIALIVNGIFGSNLMFISKNFTNTPVEWIYNISGEIFPAVMILIQAIFPFYIMYFLIKLVKLRWKR